MGVSVDFCNPKIPPVSTCTPDSPIVYTYSFFVHMAMKASQTANIPMPFRFIE